MASHPFKVVKLTHEQNQKMEIARIAFMNTCPFYAYMYHSIGEEVFTLDLPTAGTDGKHIFINPTYFCGLKVGEQVFVLIHEMSHFVARHPQRMKYYQQVGKVKTKPADMGFGNICADYVINRGIVDEYKRDIAVNPDWLFHPSVQGDELWEDVYERLWKDPPQQPPNPPPGRPDPRCPPGGGSGQGQQGQPQQPKQGSQKQPGQGGGGKGDKDDKQPKPAHKGVTWGDSGKAIKGAKGDPKAQENNGAFDYIFEPPIDPATGQEDLPSEHEFREAVARAASAAKMIGKLPADIQRLVDEVLEPKVDWRNKLRMLTTGKIGSRGETWARPNRRRLVLNPIVILPSKKPYGAGCVVVAVDTSGSIGQREYDAFFGEMKSILADCKPKEVVVMSCDARVHQMERLTTLDEFEGLQKKGLRGGGGTDFRPVFERVESEWLRPDTLVYLTDMLGCFPDEAPGYPVIWCSTSKGHEGPFGETVEIELE